MAGFWETYYKMSAPPMYDLSGADPEAKRHGAHYARQRNYCGFGR